MVGRHFMPTGRASHKVQVTHSKQLIFPTLNLKGKTDKEIIRSMVHIIIVANT